MSRRRADRGVIDSDLRSFPIGADAAGHFFARTVRNIKQGLWPYPRPDWIDVTICVDRGEVSLTLEAWV